MSASTICHYARKIGLPPAQRTRYDWDEVQAYYDQGNSLAECRQQFGMANRTITEAVRRGGRARRAAPPEKGEAG